MGFKINDTFSSFRITGIIGNGGMATVYEAYDSSLDRKVAIKTYGHSSQKNEEHLKRFQSEARALAKVNHPNVARIYSLLDYNDQFLIVMELFEGSTLNTVLDEQGPYDINSALQIYLQIAAGLSAIHSVGLIHRDLKPQNILVGNNGTVKVIDLGIAKPIIGKHPTITKENHICGTPQYMSPEQCRGEAISIPSDIWSLGLILFEILLNRKPFPGPDSDSVMELTQNADYDFSPEEIEKIPEPIREFIAQHLQKKPEHRIPDISAVNSRLVEMKKKYPNLIRFEIPKLSTPITMLTSPQSQGSTEIISTPAPPLANPPPFGEAVEKRRALIKEQTQLNHPEGLSTRFNILSLATWPPILQWSMSFFLVAVFTVPPYIYITTQATPPISLQAINNKTLTIKVPSQYNLSWDRSEGINSSQILLSKHSDLSQPFYVESPITNPSAIPFDQSHAGPIYWQVKRSVFSGLMSKETHGSFQLIPVSPPQPLTVSATELYQMPNRDSKLVSIRLKWKSDAKVSATRLQVSNDRNFFKTLFDNITKESSIALNLPQGSYFWRVSNARPIEFSGVWGPIRKIIVIPKHHDSVLRQPSSSTSQKIQ